jgi:hypothetical protein
MAPSFWIMVPSSSTDISKIVTGPLWHLKPGLCLMYLIAVQARQRAGGCWGQLA